MIFCFLLVVTHASLSLDPETVIKSFTMLRAIIPENDTMCGLDPGHDRILLGFDALAYNFGNDVIKNWIFNWSYECNVNRSGSIEINCVSDTICYGKEQKFFSCAVSGVQPDCATQIRPMPCHFIDLTDAGNNCTLILDGHEYDLSLIELEPDVFWPRFALSFTVFGSLAVIALVRSLALIVMDLLQQHLRSWPKIVCKNKRTINHTMLTSILGISAKDSLLKISVILIIFRKKENAKIKILRCLFSKC